MVVYPSSARETGLTGPSCSREVTSAAWSRIRSRVERRPAARLEGVELPQVVDHVVELGLDDEDHRAVAEAGVGADDEQEVGESGDGGAAQRRHTALLPLLRERGA